MGGIKRGDAFYIDKHATTGNEISPGRPAVIVSNNALNETSGVIEIVYLTTQPKNDMATHVLIKSLNRDSTALCEQITSVARNRIGDWCGRVSDEEMRQIELGMAVSLDLPRCCETPPYSSEAPDTAVVIAERDMYKNLYEEMLDRVVPARKDVQP